MADIPAELFTWGSLGTFTGLTGATVVVTNAVSRAVNWNPAWFGLVVAAVLCGGLAIATYTHVTDFLLAALNACLVYVSSAGANSVGVAATAKNKSLETTEVTPGSSFFRPWLP